MSTNPKKNFTPEEYLAVERKAETKSEYYDGEQFAMAGASREHNLITVNFTVEIGQHVKNRDCEVYASDMRVKVLATGLYTYPDVVVVCGEAKFEDDAVDTLLNPNTIIEVLSDTTESYDRGKKFEHYQKINSLGEYILVSQKPYRIEQFVKRSSAAWEYVIHNQREQALELHSLKCKIPLAEIYRRVPEAS